jgi:hypothetical protein
MPVVKEVSKVNALEIEIYVEVEKRVCRSPD